MTKKKVIRNFGRENGHFFREKSSFQKFWSAKIFSVPPPNSAPGLRRCSIPVEFSLSLSVFHFSLSLSVTHSLTQSLTHSLTHSLSLSLSDSLSACVSMNCSVFSSVSLFLLTCL